MGLTDTLASYSGVRSLSLIGTAFITAFTYLVIRFLRTRKSRPTNGVAAILESPILRDGSSVKSYTTTIATYPRIRTFYRPHKHREKLQVIAELPLLVFIHGLGGSLEQFVPLLGSLSNVGPCFGIELPGHGSSAFDPRDFAAYTTNAFAALWQTAIADTCQKHEHSKVVLIGHSMGCSISALLATELNRKFEVVGNIAICPKASPPTESQSSYFRRFLSLPDFLLNAIRYIDKMGSVESKSVKRFVGKGADPGLKQMQLHFNEQFKTPVWKRAAVGCIATYDVQSNPHGGLPGSAIWSKIEVPLLLVAGEADIMTKPNEVADIASCLQRHKPSAEASGSLSRVQTASEPVPTVTVPTVTEAAGSAEPTAEGPTKSDHSSVDQAPSVEPAVTEKTSHHSIIVKTAILPSPASHALLYDPRCYRTLAGLIEDFLVEHISPHLSLGWQLQSLTTTGKWDVKNLEKWQRTLPVSGPICTRPPTRHGLFRALKTLREQDETHTPRRFLADWRDKIYAVIDISHDAPIYDTKAMDKGGIHYRKFPTVSKVPPTVTEVCDFIALVDQLRTEMETNGQDDKAVGVHCHYGYNRTGFFICCYLIERMGFQVQDAVDEFKKAKPPGIRHDHFVDTLYVRYCVGLKRAATMEINEDSDR